MKQVSFLFISLLTAVIFLGGCKKQENPVDNNSGNPGGGNENQAPEGRLIANIDGESYMSDAYRLDNGTGYTIHEGNFIALITSSGQFTVWGRQENSEKIIAVNGLPFGGIYPAAGVKYTSSANNFNASYYIGNSSWTQKEWQTNSKHTGEITFTKFDTAANLASGTFSFRAEANNDNTQSSVTITNGAFKNIPIIKN